MTDYLSQIRTAIKYNHGCESAHLDTIAIRERFQGKVVWDGTVEIFALFKHPKALRCYAWGNTNEKNGWDITTVLEIPPVDSAQSAVRVAIAASARAKL